MTLIEFVSLKLAILTVLSQVFVLLVVIYFAFGFLNRRGILQIPNFQNAGNQAVEFLSKYGLLAVFLVTLAATLSSLFYSEVAGYEPCTLCWYQRILMYPQVILLGLALFKKDRGIVDYSIMLSSIGALLAGYHYLMQIGAFNILPCSAIGYSVSCAQLFLMQFGYITLPLMSLTAFVLTITFLVFVKLKKSN